MSHHAATRITCRLPRWGVAAFMLCLATSGVFAQERRTERAPAGLSGPRLRVGVLDLSGTALSMQTAVTPGGTTTTTVALPPPAEFARGLTQMLTTTLIAHPQLVVLERAQVDRVLAEQEFTRSGVVTRETSIGLGRMLGAQVLITGDVTEFSYRQSSLGSAVNLLNRARQVGGRGERVSAQVAIDLRLIDAVTGAVIGSARGEGEASAIAVAADLAVADKEIGVGGTAQTPLGKASRSAIEDAVGRLVAFLADVPWAGRVSDVRGSEVYVNAGSSLGIVAGMEFEVFAEGEPVRDPATGEVLGAPETRMGRLRITQVTDRFAVGRMVEGGPVQTNHIVRYIGSENRRQERAASEQPTRKTF